MGSLDFSIICDCGAQLDVLELRYEQNEVQIITDKCESCADDEYARGCGDGIEEAINY